MLTFLHTLSRRKTYLSTTYKFSSNCRTAKAQQTTSLTSCFTHQLLPNTAHCQRAFPFVLQKLAPIPMINHHRSRLCSKPLYSLSATRNTCYSTLCTVNAHFPSFFNPPSKDQPPPFSYLLQAPNTPQTKGDYMHDTGAGYQPPAKPHSHSCTPYTLDSPSCSLSGGWETCSTGPILTSVLTGQSSANNRRLRNTGVRMRTFCKTPSPPNATHR